MTNLCDTCSKRNRCAVYQNRKDWGNNTPVTKCTNYKEVKGIMKLLSKK